LPRASAPIAGKLAVASPLAIPERKVEDVLREGAPLPGAIVEPLTRAVDVVSERLADLAPASAEPQRVKPGSLGVWAGSTEFEIGNA
jgi:hypothetical protein